MASLDAVLTWLGGLPTAALYSTMSLLAAIENIFPPIPADVLVAFGGFLAARSGNPPWPAFLAVWGGNLAGACGMYWLGRRYGASRVEQRYHLDRTGGADDRVRRWYARYGTAAFFVARFVPGVRAVVPPLAGALRLPAVGVIVAMGLASAAWYGTITWLAFRAGVRWESLRGAVARFSSVTSVIAAGFIALAALAWWSYRRRARAHRPPA